MTGRELEGVRVLVTRPAHQAERLCRLIEQAGGIAVRFPTLAIAGPSDPTAAARRLEAAADYDLLIFISPNAVEGAVALMEPARLAEARLAVVGKGTAAALTGCLGRRPDLLPTERFDSEGLLALPELGLLNGERVLIVRGEGGRELLADTLRARGAQVSYAEVYRRVLPEPCPPGVEVIGGIDVITATSSEALANLERLLGHSGVARHHIPLAVIAERIAEKARELGYVGPILVAGEPGDEALMAVIARWLQERQENR